MRLYYYFHGLRDDKSERNVPSWLDELKRNLAGPELTIELNVKKLPAALAEKVDRILKLDESWIHRLSEKIRSLRVDRLSSGEFSDNDLLLICCRGDSRVAHSCLEANPYAKYGAAQFEFGVAYVYNPSDRATYWHEVFHLLGAEDCYDQAGNSPTCGMKNCIMQYGIADSEIGEWPLICSENIKRMKTTLKSM